jgi:DNA-binding response OmpR family regulator
MSKEIKILLAEDDVNLGFVIRDNLEQNGLKVDLCKDGKEALDHFLSNSYQVCVLDVMMPKIDGFDLANKIRQHNKEIPVLFLTARTMKEDRLRGFLVGGDDYITKPFSIEELICRIKVFLKRSKITAPAAGPPVSFGKCTLNHQNLQLKINNEVIRLTQMEADILLLLLNNGGEVIKRSEILNKIWGEDDYFNGRSLDVFISRLRKILSADPTVSISNIHGVGFRLESRI